MRYPLRLPACLSSLDSLCWWWSRELLLQCLSGTFDEESDPSRGTAFYSSPQKSMQKDVKHSKLEIGIMDSYRKAGNMVDEDPGGI
ncbi:hypothetical protein NDU88_001968 [Pleurodeles waltl]|uniref:Uncharacterized protein n=1 Tax=Pleurodeles waltl TaxID=8319 RepID=A0AAV7NE16_PLEWA|nr:hypothetical protein NDU88_001968 [Pleurodeles waltl]